MKGWNNNKAEMLDGGSSTIRVMNGRVMNEGEEILMAYHAEYWHRWMPRARKRARGAAAATDEEHGQIMRRRGAAGAVAPDDGSGAAAVDVGGADGVATGQDSPGVSALCEDGGWYGRRVGRHMSRDDSLTGKKRGRPSKPITDLDRVKHGGIHRGC